MLWILSWWVMVFNSTPNPNYTNIRSLYEQSLSDPTKISQFEAETQLTGSNNTTTLMAFHATALALKARESTWVSTKLSLAKKAHSLLNQSVSANSSNCEIRFLRLSFEYNTPAFLGMKSHIANDKLYLMNHLKSTEPLFAIMVAFFRDCKDLTEVERKSLIER